MTGQTWLTAALGTALLTALGLLAYGLTGTPTADVPRHRFAPRPRWQMWRWPAAIAGGIVAWALTGWPVTFPAAALIVWAGPALLGGTNSEKRAIDRVEGVGDWARRLSDVLLLGTGLEQALTGSARAAPASIAGEVKTMAARLQAHWPTETALRAMADQIADPVADTVLAALILAGQRRGPGLAKALSGLADSTAEQVANRRRIEADRARPRATARAVTLITLLVIAAALLNTDYLAPYSSPLGQLLFAAVATGFTACLWWMHALTRPTARARVLTADPGRSEEVRV